MTRSRTTVLVATALTVWMAAVPAWASGQAAPSSPQPALSAAAPVTDAATLLLPTDEGDPVDPAGQFTWGIVPADAAGVPDNRVSFRLDVAPGGTVTEHALVTNYSTTPITFDIRASDGVVTEDGVFDILPADMPSTDVGTWVTVQPTVDVPAGQSVLVPFTLTVPEIATPGDHPGGIVASISQSSQQTGGPQVGLTSRVGVRLHLRVTGDIRPLVSFSDVATRYEGSVNPLEPGRLHITYTITNDGNVRLSSIQQAEIKGPFGWPTGAQGPSGTVVGQQREILPGQSSTVSVTMEDTWPTGRIDTRLLATQDVVGDDPNLGTIPRVSSTASTFALPWSQLITLALAVALVGGSIHRHVTRKAKVAQAIERARAEGAGEVAVVSTEAPSDGDDDGMAAGVGAGPDGDVAVEGSQDPARR